jgi:hypothetical protein
MPLSHDNIHPLLTSTSVPMLQISGILCLYETWVNKKSAGCRKQASGVLCCSAAPEFFELTNFSPTADMSQLKPLDVFLAQNVEL